MVPGLRLGGAIGDCEDCVSGSQDLEEETWFATYAYGPLTIGYQQAEEDSGTTSYDTDVYGVSFNVNDDLSVSYGEHQSRKAGYTNHVVQSGENTRVVEVSSWQAAYTMGGASFRIADVKADNVAFSGGLNRSATVVSLGLAF